MKFGVNDCLSLSRFSFSSDSFVDSVFPDLIKIQRDSYQLFMYGNTSEGKASGLHNTFRSVFPIEEGLGKATLEFVDCKLGDVRYDEYESIKRSATYSVSLRALLRLVVWEVNPDTKFKSIKNIKEQDVYIGDIPMMTEKGTFIINGVERVVVSQLHRSPGVFFDYSKSKTGDSKVTCIAKIVPYRGSWLDFEFSSKGLIFFRIDKKRKLPVVILLRALCLSNVDILEAFYDNVLYQKSGSGWSYQFLPEKFADTKIKFDLIDVKTKEIIVPAGSYLSASEASRIYDEGLTDCFSSDLDIVAMYFAKDVIYGDNVLIKAGMEIRVETLNQLRAHNIDDFYVVRVGNKSGSSLLDSLLSCPNVLYEDALAEIYNVIRPGESPSLESAKLLFHEMFFDSSKYDLSPVGRMKIGIRFGVAWDESQTVLTKQDVIATIKELILINNGHRSTDDIDNLSNRRVRSVGEFIENQLRIGLLRMQKIIIEYMSAVDVDIVMPFDLVNSKILMAVIKEFFVSSPLSQFMDQTNPLSEITHKRRLSALGPGGLNRERAGFEVRDVHTSHRGRICPIETPEGQNIGLISSLATCARISKYGFIEAPYRKVKDGVVSHEIEYLSSIEEHNCNIAQANVVLDKKGRLIDSIIHCRNSGDVLAVPRDDVHYIDLTPKQIVSVAASLIPFLENNDANRALMGSNMQRQAVPLLKAKAAIVGTGMEYLIAKGSGTLVIAKFDGCVRYVSFDTIIISSASSDFRIEKYDLCKYKKSNDNTLVNQKPLVKVGDYVKAGDVIADGVATDQGELALGCNLVVVFMSWKGYNFEDSIVISDGVIERDMFTSVHIEEYECVVRDTRLGPEEITRDIPNIGEEFLCHLDESGIVHLGAEVTEGDILVGKVTPKSESFVTPEEKLLRAIFGEKAIDVRDTSLYLPPGVSGKVIDVRIFLRRGIVRDGRAALIQQQRMDAMKRRWASEIKVITEYAYELLEKVLLGKKASKILTGIITKDRLVEIAKEQWWSIGAECDTAALRKQLDIKLNELNNYFESEVEKIQSDDANLNQGVLRIVKVFVAMRHNLQPGDKMAGRHGNKGVISKIVAKEDMPYLADGTSVDIVLNSLGIPSRMNVGQVMEAHLGWVCIKLRKKIRKLVHDLSVLELRELLCKIYFKNDVICHKVRKFSDDDLLLFGDDLSDNLSFSAPVFESPKDDDISYLLNLAGLDASGQEDVYDGITSEKFDRKVTVGSIYILKLHHLVNDKMHARSVGPYSLITQQPLGGKSYFGGQRFGEMECWALQAYGASYTMQEILTVKSDDVVGRIKLYDSIIRNDNDFACGVPESFYVMLNELRALCLDVQLYQDDEIVNDN